MTVINLRPQRVAIIGGGVAGTLAAVILSELPNIGEITLLDRTGAFGRGLAYSARAPWHRINVPAYKMGGLNAEDADGFTDWLAANGHVTGPDYSTSFVPRWLYGQYLQDQLTALTSRGRAGTRHDSALSIEGIDGAYRIATASGDDITADLVFVCIGNHPPSAFRGIVPSPRSVTNVWATGALDAIAANDDVLVIGTGATAVDVVIDLVHRGMRKPITMVSRRALLPQIDAPAQTDPAPMTTWPVLTTRGLFHALREDIRRKAADGIPWQTVIDTFRLQTQGFWKSFNETERARFSRHLRSIWLVHRHRLAPDVAALLQQMQQDARLRIVAGRITSATVTAPGYDVTMRVRGRDTLTIATNWILNCTGPEERYDRIDDPFIQSLLTTGHARPGKNGLGLDVDPHCQLHDKDGQIQSGLYAIGPATRGAFWEVTAATNIRQQLLDVAATLASAPTPGAGNPQT